MCLAVINKPCKGWWHCFVSWPWLWYAKERITYASHVAHAWLQCKHGQAGALVLRDPTYGGISRKPVVDCKAKCCMLSLPFQNLCTKLVTVYQWHRSVHCHVQSTWCLWQSHVPSRSRTVFAVCAQANAGGVLCRYVPATVINQLSGIEHIAFTVGVHPPQISWILTFAEQVIVGPHCEP